MAAQKIRLLVITPHEQKADEQADMVIMHCTNGYSGILPGHDARSFLLDYGVLRIFDNGEERRIAVFGGVAEIREDVLTILTTGAELPEEINLARAESERERIERRMQENIDDIDIQRDQVLLRRSLVQIEVSASPLITSPDWTGLNAGTRSKSLTQ
ncbi:MAG: ATP synthase F1 subunit epsilon [Clostridiales bacterium]|nr:ATP synthase F1 subunit epsilon [Clostridiales bacterium]